MSREIDFSGQLTVEEIRRGMALADPSMGSFSMVLKALAAAEAGLLVWYGVTNGLDVGVMTVGLSMLTWVLFHLGHSIRKRENEMWEDDPEWTKCYSGTLSEQGVEVSGEGFWRKTAWSQMKGWKGDQSMFLLRLRNSIYVFPLHHFQTESDWIEARAMCAAHLPELPSKQGKR